MSFPKTLPVSPLITSFHKWSGKPQRLLLTNLNHLNGVQNQLNIDKIKNNWIAELLCAPLKRDKITRRALNPKTLSIPFTLAKDSRISDDDMHDKQRLWIVPILSDPAVGSELLMHQKFIPKAYIAASKRYFDRLANYAPKLIGEESGSSVYLINLKHRLATTLLPSKTLEQLSGLSNVDILVRLDMGDKVLLQLVKNALMAWDSLMHAVEEDGHLKLLVFDRRKKVKTTDVVLDLNVDDEFLSLLTTMVKEQRNYEASSRRSKSFEHPKRVFIDYACSMHASLGHQPTVVKLGNLQKYIDTWYLQLKHSHLGDDIISRLSELLVSLQQFESKKRVLMHENNNPYFKTFLNSIIMIALYCE